MDENQPDTQQPDTQRRDARCATPLDDLTTIEPSDWRAWVGFGHRCAAFDWAAHADRACRAPASRTAGRPAYTLGVRVHSLTMHAYREEQPGRRWQRLFTATWPAYRAWYAKEGLAARPSLDSARAALRAHMPELVPTWARLVELCGHDETAARMLTLWNVPAFEAGCSQAVLPGSEPVLVRNYDYDLALFEGVAASTNYSGRRRVIGTSDCLWGLLDGMNEDGLVVSLTLGGRPGSGAGFGIPLVVRYLLETCATVAEAVTRLQRLPVAQAYNLTLADATGDHATVFVSPGEAPEVSDLAVATNHRLTTVEHPRISGPLRSLERQEHLARVLSGGPTGSELTEAFFRPPAHTSAYSRGFGTLYTARYELTRGAVTYLWPDRAWERRFDSSDASVSVSLREPPEH